MSARVSPSPIVHPPVCLLDNAPKPVSYNIFGRIIFELDTFNTPPVCLASRLLFIFVNINWSTQLMINTLCVMHC